MGYLHPLDYRGDLHDSQASSSTLYTDQIIEQSHFSIPPAETPLSLDIANFSIYEAVSAKSQSTIRKMPKKRRSLQSIFVPSFLQSNSPSILTSPVNATGSHSRGTARRSISRPTIEQDTFAEPTVVASSSESRSISPPPDFLLDDDPFADLSTGTTTTTTPPLSPPKTFFSSSRFSPEDIVNGVAIRSPRSPLSPTPSSAADGMERISFDLIASSATPPLVRTASIGNGPRPAYQKPAFKSRPSLPSLHTLAKMNVVLPKKVRRGHVGARLPFEPWDVGGEPVPDLPVNHHLSDLAADISQISDFSHFCASLDGLDKPFELEFSRSSFDGYTSSTDEFSAGTPSIITTDVEDSHDETPEFVQGSSSESSPSPPQRTRPRSNSLGTFLRLSHSRPRNWSRWLTTPEMTFSPPAPSHGDYGNPSPKTSNSKPEFIPVSSPTFPNDDFGAVGSDHSRGSSSRLSDSDLDMPLFPSLRKSTLHPNDFADEPSSVGTIRPTKTITRSGVVVHRLLPDDKATPVAPADGGEHQSTSNSGQWDPYSSSSIAGTAAGGWLPGANAHASQGGHGGGHGGDERDGGDQRPSYLNVSSSSSDESESESSDDYGREDTRATGHAGTSRPTQSSGDSGDDDVPLAQRIPTALKAQRTIRQQVRDERDQRRKERAELAAETRSRQTTLRPTDASYASRMPAMNNFEASTSRLGRPRTQTLPAPVQPGALDITGLTSKLMGVQASENGRQMNPNPSDPVALQRSATQQQSRHRSNPATPLETGRNMLRPTKSLHQQGGRQEPARSTRPSGEVQRPPAAQSTKSPRPPVPSLPTESPKTPQVKSAVVQQRIFVGDMQRFKMVELSQTTTAQDVVWMIEEQGGLDEWVGVGDWSVWEMASDFGLERPIRSNELMFDIMSSWNKDKSVNTFVMKISPMGSLLKRAATLTSSPTHKGYVEWEAKRGKWSKRWLELREHSLWLSKRDNGKDEILLCSLSTFDAYFVKSLHKAPKPFVFAVKSTDNMALFEDVSDFLHIFSCRTQEGDNWMEKILLARSYVLHQERNVLHGRPGGYTTAAPASGPLVARAGTTRQPTTHRAGQPLVHIAPPLTSVTAPTRFEPGSLLARAA